MSFVPTASTPSSFLFISFHFFLNFPSSPLFLSSNKDSSRDVRSLISAMSQDTSVPFLYFVIATAPSIVTHCR